MLRKVLLLAVLLALASSPAFAQRVEVSASVGWTFSDGVSFDGTVPINGNLYDRVDPADAASFGFTFGVYLTPQAEIEFLWNRQATTLDVTGAGNAARLRGDMNIDTYHANFIYNAGDEDTPIRPFFYLGLGATNYGDAEFTGRTLPGVSKFSWALGGGVKAFASRNVGFKGTATWRPTYIKTDDYGWWCDPFWGCTVVGDANFANQFEFSGGVVLRF
jgi:hypothetical protein